MEVLSIYDSDIIKTRKSTNLVPNTSYSSKANAKKYVTEKVGITAGQLDYINKI